VSINWQRTDGASIPAGSRIEKLDFSTRLQISQLLRTDEGAYSCTGQNKAGSTSFSIQLLVHGWTFTNLLNFLVYASAFCVVIRIAYPENLLFVLWF